MGKHTLTNRYGSLLNSRLNDLYWREGKSLAEIAKIEGVRPPSIHKAMERLGIAVRSYEEAHVFKPNLEATPNLAYTLGVILGDGNTSENGIIRLRVTDRKFAESFYQALTVLNLKPKIITEVNGGLGKKPIHNSYAYSKRFVEWFKGLGIEGIRKIVLMNMENATTFVRGFYESEGGCSKVKVGNPHPIIGNTNRELLGLVKEAIDMLGYSSNITGPYPSTAERYKDIYHLYISRSQGYDFLDEIDPCIKTLGGM